MRRAAPVILSFLPFLALAACSGGDGTDERQSPSPQPNAATTAASVPATPALPADAITSSYTRLDLSACTVVDREEEGASTDWRCPGRDGVPLFVYESDGRFDLDAGLRNASFTTLSAFNTLGDRVEWRLRGGRPFAVIFRFRDATQEAGGRTVLAVEKVGSGDTPGCRVAQVAGDTPRANGRARELADGLAASFDCDSGQVRYIGAAR